MFLAIDRIVFDNHLEMFYEPSKNKNAKDNHTDTQWHTHTHDETVKIWPTTNTHHFELSEPSHIHTAISYETFSTQLLIVKQIECFIYS